MGKRRDSELLGGALIREYRFSDREALNNYISKIKGKHYILELTFGRGEECFATIATQYNNAPLWKENKR